MTGSLIMVRPPRLAEIYVRLSDVIMKTIATTVVIFSKKLVEPVAPKTVWVDPPKAAPKLAPLPVCRSTIQISAMQTIT